MSKIACKECGAEVHVIKNHLQQAHPEITIEDYQTKYPGAPLMSEQAKKLLEDQLAKKQPAATTADPSAPAAPAKKEDTSAFVGAAAYQSDRQPMHEVFNLGRVKAAMSSKSGNPIPISVLTSTGSPELVPPVDAGYVFDIEELKNFMLAFEWKIPVYVFGHKGAGKTELTEQIAARTGRPLVRLQHTMHTEEAHVVGQWTVKAGETVFNLGPLPLAMINGWIFLADEYDFALPSLTATYQAVLEGKNLYIKDAPPEMRIVKPHPNFRFVATGNTNGSGDETGLYQGTNVQNSANYDRFGMMIAKGYMPRDAEIKILRNRTGVDDDDAKKIVEFGGLVRNAFNDGKISDTISPRTLINATRIGVARASYKHGLTLSFINKLSAIDRKVVEDIAQRIFA